MIYPQEIEVWYVLPAIRRELTKSLVSHGLSQKEIAIKLEVTEAAVSQYIKEKRASSIKFNPVIKEEIQKSAKRIMKNNNVMKEIEHIIHLMKKTKVLCQIHHRYDKNLPGICDICVYEQ